MSPPQRRGGPVRRNRPFRLLVLSFEPPALRRWGFPTLASIGTSGQGVGLVLQTGRGVPVLTLHYAVSSRPEAGPLSQGLSLEAKSNNQKSRSGPASGQMPRGHCRV